MKENKFFIPLVAVSCLCIGFASAKIISHYSGTERPVNIFDFTKEDCKDLRWKNPADSFQAVFPVSVEGNLFFAGERVPLEDPDIRERLEREIQLSVYFHSQTIMQMKLANRYFPGIESILVKNGVPGDLKYQALVESSFRYDVSPMGAVGFWQFLKETGKMNGLEINEEVDERYHYEKATEAACKYLKEAHDQLGNWTLAVASYNLGLPSMKQRVKDQKTNNYYEMFFNPETSRYVLRMVAMKIIFSNPEKAGFHLTTDDLYQPYKFKTAEVDSSITSIADFAAQFGLKYKHIKILNPWLRNARLTNAAGKKYAIKILELN